jgi:hypothetical protein
MHSAAELKWESKAMRPLRDGSRLQLVRETPAMTLPPADRWEQSQSD